MSPTGPLLVAAADTLLLDLSHPEAESCRAKLARFAQLESSPEHVHTFKLTEIGLWNASAAGLDAMTVLDSIDRFSPTPVPHSTAVLVTETMDRFGQVTIENHPEHPDLLVVTSMTEAINAQVNADRDLSSLVVDELGERGLVIRAHDRGQIKSLLTTRGLPPNDMADLDPGYPHRFELSPQLKLRPYQRNALDSWQASGTGVVVLPCGAGKTVVGVAAAAEVGANTLVLVTSESAMDQWEREFSRFTNLDRSDIGRYSARTKQIRPITLATYSVLTARRQGQFCHLGLFQDNGWGLVIYDEAHLLPAPVFNMTTSIQSRRRLGLTATLVREDGKERDVFALIGPKRFDMPWRELEMQGWLATVSCHEIRVIPTPQEKLTYAQATAKTRPRLAAEIGGKVDRVVDLVGRHHQESILIIGTYVDQLETIAARLGAPVITGTTPVAHRVELFDRFRRGEVRVLVVSKLGSHSLDLPEVSVAIQVSGTFGSRQEEAQRLGRILRPKGDGRMATFYSLVSQDTVEVDYAARRQRFLAEQGYTYSITDGQSTDGQSTDGQSTDGQSTDGRAGFHLEVDSG